MDHVPGPSGPVGALMRTTSVLALAVSLALGAQILRAPTASGGC